MGFTAAELAEMARADAEIEATFRLTNEDLALGRQIDRDAVLEGMDAQARKRAEYNRRYYEAHKDERAEYQRRYYEAHKDERAEYQRRYREAHKDERAEYNRRYYEAHKDERAEYQRRYYEAHKDERAEYQRRYRRRKRMEAEGNVNMICKIDRITDRTDHPVKPRNYLTGRTGRLVELDEGHPLVIDFGGTSLVTSPVADIRQSRRMIRVQTRRTVYYLREEEDRALLH